ncbi:unnamed protein product [Callosobruchus maculatus]|uniref:Uncharacterized protein n=1 Tax=Callosobruchus maculatus TaxID=64391 RepID=A0A653BQQ2_CALMS|nr:unnamed protein product [Callosobruchus maculatus]
MDTISGGLYLVRTHPQKTSPGFRSGAYGSHCGLPELCGAPGPLLVVHLCSSFITTRNHVRRRRSLLYVG